MFVLDFPVSTEERLERENNSLFRRWLNLPRSLSSIALYISGNMMLLPHTSLVEEYKVTNAQQAITFRDHRDVKVRRARIKTGR